MTVDDYSLAGELTRQINELCPGTSLSIGDMDDRTTWILRFSSQSTGAQQLEAQAKLEGFNLDVERVKLQAKRDLSAMDSSMSRVFEDCLVALVSKNVISLEDIPVAARNKLTARNNLRAKV